MFTNQCILNAQQCQIMLWKGRVCLTHDNISIRYLTLYTSEAEERVLEPARIESHGDIRMSHPRCGADCNLTPHCGMLRVMFVSLRAVRIAI